MENSTELTKKQLIRLVECPRDAMQGWARPIATDNKIRYINALLKVGFDTLDFGSFVSPRAIPQMADTKKVLEKLEFNGSKSQLLAIIANERGAAEAAEYNEIQYLGYPFSISETFQLRNTNAGIHKSLSTVANIQEICLKKNKQLVIYISMAFGNPYGDPWNETIVYEWIDKLSKLDINIFSLADTVGLATAEQVAAIASHVVNEFTDFEIGAHLHAHPGDWQPKVAAAIAAGCKRIDSAMKGFGGCPMAGNELVGNINTELLVPYLQEQGLAHQLNMKAFAAAAEIADAVFI